MKRWMMIATLAMALVLAFGAVAWAQGPNPTPGTCPMGLEPGTGGEHGMGPRNGGGMPDWAGQPEAVEQLLGMTEDEIHAARQAGQSLVQIAGDKGVTEEALVAAILNEKKAELDQAVTDGKLTQERADAMYQRMQSQVPVMINRTTVGPMQRGGMMQGFGSGQGQPPAGMQRGGMQQGGMMGPRWSR